MLIAVVTYMVTVIYPRSWVLWDSPALPSEVSPAGVGRYESRCRTAALRTWCMRDLVKQRRVVSRCFPGTPAYPNKDTVHRLSINQHRLGSQEN